MMIAMVCGPRRCLALTAGLVLGACTLADPPARAPAGAPPIADRQRDVVLTDASFDGRTFAVTLRNDGGELFDRVWLRLTFVDGTDATERKLLAVPSAGLPLLVPGAVHFLSATLDDLAGRELGAAELELVALPEPGTAHAITAREAWDPRPAHPLGVPAYPRRAAEPFDWIVVHHSAFAVPEGPLAISRYHREVRRFADIGYQFVIDEGGRIYAGRDLSLMGAHAGESLEANQGVARGRRTDDPAAVQAARALDPDWGSLGVVVDGFFEDGGEPTAAQLAALRWLVVELSDRYAIPAGHLIGHREVADAITRGRGLTPAGRETTCPGPGLQRVVEALRHERGAVPGS